MHDNFHYNISRSFPEMNEDDPRFIILIDRSSTMATAVDIPMLPDATNRLDAAKELATRLVDNIFEWYPEPDFHPLVSVMTFRALDQSADFFGHTMPTIQVVTPFTDIKSQAQDAIYKIAGPMGDSPLVQALCSAENALNIAGYSSFDEEYDGYPPIEEPLFKYLYVFTDGGQDDWTQLENVGLPYADCFTFPVAPQWKPGCDPGVCTGESCYSHQCCLAQKLGSLAESGIEKYITYFGPRADDPIDGTSHPDFKFLKYIGDNTGWFQSISDHPLMRVEIGTLADVVQGTTDWVPIGLSGSESPHYFRPPFDLGGFDFLIVYDPTVLTFLEAQAGQLLEDCEWEYFTFRTGVDGNCGGPCPSGLVRVVAIADMNNGLEHPSCFGPPDTDPHELVKLKFYVSQDLTFEGQHIPVEFYWADCGDNAISSIDGNITYLDRRIFGATGNLLWDEDDDVQFPEDARPQGLGAPDVCLEGSGPDKPKPIRFIDFGFGGIDIIPRDSLDAPGDINLNGIYNEVADAVLFSNYFIYGDAVWDPPYREGQIAATDVNMDGVTLTIADLVYLIRIITGDETPFPKTAPQELQATVDWQISDGDLVVNWECLSPAGAMLLAFDHHSAVFGEPILGANASGMTVISHNNGPQLRVLIYGAERGVSIPAGKGTILRVPIVSDDPGLMLGEVEAADYWGNMLTVSAAQPAFVPRAFALFQNVPNPFNATTRIDFNLAEAGDVSLPVYNVLGQRVATLIDEHLEPGRHYVEWDSRGDNGSELPSGVYFYRLITANNQASRKMVLLK